MLLSLLLTIGCGEADKSPLEKCKVKCDKIIPKYTTSSLVREKCWKRVFWGVPKEFQDKQNKKFKAEHDDCLRVMENTGYAEDESCLRKCNLEYGK